MDQLFIYLSVTKLTFHLPANVNDLSCRSYNDEETSIADQILLKQ